VPFFIALLFLLIVDGSFAHAQTVRTVENAGAVNFVQKTQGQCTALAPADWQIVSTRPQGEAIDMSSGDRQSYVGWVIHGVDRMAQITQGDLFGDPPTSSRVMVGMMAKATFGDPGPFTYVGQPVQLGADFIAAVLQSAAHKAVLIYKVYPAPASMSYGSYIISQRIAIVPIGASDMQTRTAVGVAAGVSCVTVFTPPKNNDITLPRPGDTFDRRRRSGETNDLEGYNSQLGTQYVHSPSTGQNYLVDRTAAWNDTGPDGPGYYRKVGNSYEKLEAGMR
jgi:hypothetical protein